jgi:lysophospholipase L1-like esterase
MITMKALLIFTSILIAGLNGSAFADDGDRKALVLGDSVASGYVASVGYDYFYTRPDNFVGFANDLEDWLHLEVANGSCPGETTGSLLSSTAPDNGCRAYREAFRLHVDYPSTQRDFAADYLKRHREVRLVTITLGANDGLLTGLLNPAVNTPYACNIHPARTGHRLIATTVAHAVHEAELASD